MAVSADASSILRRRATSCSIIAWQDPPSMEHRATSATIRQARTSLYCMVGQRRDRPKRSRLRPICGLLTSHRPLGPVPNCHGTADSRLRLGFLSEATRIGQAASRRTRPALAFREKPIPPHAVGDGIHAATVEPPRTFIFCRLSGKVPAPRLGVFRLLGTRWGGV